MFPSLISLLTFVTLTVHIQVIDPKEGQVLATCSAVYISPTEALTAAHCVEDTTGKIWVKDSYSKSFSASVEKKDKRIDLCLLKIECPPHLFVVMGKPTQIGNRIYLMSSEEDMPYTYAEGIVENITDDDEAGLTVIHSASILPGASGSGLFNWRGQLVGINTAMLRNLSMAVDETAIHYFLRDRN